MKTTLLKTIAIVFSMSFLACEKEEPETTRVAVYLTDAPVELAEVNIHLVGVEVHSPDFGWDNLPTDTGIYNLLDYQNDSLAKIVDYHTVASSKINQCRLILGDSNTILTTDSIIHPLMLSSQDKEGLKIDLGNDLRTSNSLDIVLDFDAQKSVVLTGNGTYKLKPVLILK